MPNRYATCVHCGHAISGYKMPYSKDWQWWHYKRANGAKRGSARIRCFVCGCVQPEPAKLEKEVS
jgi:hypothetical protein